MSIDTLGKSLLASAKKKSKKQKYISYGLLGLMGVNRVIRQKAIKRAEEFNNSLIPIKKKLTGEFNTIAKAKSDYEKRENHIEGAYGSFLEDERNAILNLAAKSKTSIDLKPEELNQLAKENLEKRGTYKTYQETVNTYKPYFDMDEAEFFLQYNKLAKGGEEIKSDNILDVMGRGLRLTDRGKLIDAKVKLSNAESVQLSLPEQLYETLDIPFLQELEKIEERKTKIEDIKSKEIVTLYAEDGEVTALLNRVTKDRQVKNPKIEKPVEDSWNYVNSSTYDDPETLEKDMVDNPFYIGTLTFIGKDNEGKDVKSNITIEQLEEQLSKTFEGQKIGSFAQQQMTDWDIFVRDSKVIAQSKYYNHVNTKGSTIPTEKDFNQWMVDAIMENAKQIELTPTTKGMLGFRKGLDKATLKFVKVENGQGAGQVDNTKILVNFKTFLDNQEDTKNENVQNDIKQFISKYPEFKKELQSYIVNTQTNTLSNNIGTTLVDPVETIPSSLDAEENTETNNNSLLSKDKTYRSYSEVMADDSLTEEEKMDELSQRPRDELFSGIKSIPSKMKLRSLNQTKERANKFLEGKSSGFYDSKFTKWKKENNITTTFKTPKDEYRKYVRQFLDDLENQTDLI